MSKKYKRLIFVSFCLLYPFLIFLLVRNKKDKVVTVTKEVESLCRGDEFCKASKACKEQDGRLKNFHGNNWKTEYSFECEYE